MYLYIYICIYIYIPQTSFSLWGSYLYRKELPKGLPPSKLPMFHLFVFFTFETNEILRKATFPKMSSYRSPGIPVHPKAFL